MRERTKLALLGIVVEVPAMLSVCRSCVASPAWFDVEPALIGRALTSSAESAS